MSKHKDADTNTDAGTDAETNEYGHSLDRTVWRKGNDNGKNVSVYHTREDCQYLKTNAASTIPCKLRTLPSHRPCKGCTGDIDRTGPAEFKGLRNMINNVDDSLEQSIWITRSAWDNNNGCFHTSQTCTMILRADDVVEIQAKALPNIPHKPCDYCCGDEIRELEQILTDRYNIDNPDKRLTVGDLYQKQHVWIAANTNHQHLVHLSDDCQHIDQSNNPMRKAAMTLHNDRGICKKCSQGWTKQGEPSEHNNLAARLRASDNPQEILDNTTSE